MMGKNSYNQQETSPCDAALRFASPVEVTKENLKQGGSVAAQRAATEPRLSQKTCHVERPEGVRHLLPGCGESDDGKKRLQSCRRPLPAMLRYASHLRSR